MRLRTLSPTEKYRQTLRWRLRRLEFLAYACLHNPEKATVQEARLIHSAIEATKRELEDA